MVGMSRKAKRLR